MTSSQSLKILSFIVITLVVSIFLSCSDDSDPGTSNDPANLVFNAEVSDDDSGIVNFMASADNTIEFRFYTGDGNPNEPFISSDGNFEYQYEKFGTYITEVRAYGSSGRFVKKTQQIVVQIGGSTTVGQGYTSPTSYEGLELVWTDEFEGTQLNTSNWTYEIGDGCPNLCGWGNSELQYYRQQNAYVSGGVLTIEARKENFQGRSYTSARLISRDKQSFKFGRIDIRAQLPEGQGLWPALWMLGINQPSVGWPKCGEIDIMEMIGGAGRENSVHGSAHWDEGGRVFETGTYTKSSGTFADEFHVFSIIWNEEEICYMVNDNEYYTFSTVPSQRSAFQKEFFFIMNVAVGGNWPGNPDDNTTFPANMKVDYIRVFQ